MREYLFFVLLSIAVALSLSNAHRLWIRTPINVPLLLLIVSVLVTVPFALAPSYSFTEWTGLLIRLMAFYWALLVLQSQPVRAVVKGTLAALIAGTLIQAGFALVDFTIWGVLLAPYL